MPSLALSALPRALQRGEIAPIYYVHGADDLRKDDAVRRIVDAVLDPGLRDFNLDKRSAQTLDADAVEPLCATLPMMADRRVVIIRDVEAWRRKGKAKSAFLAWAARPQPETVAILVQGDDEKPDTELAKVSTTVEAEPFAPDEAAAWAIRRAEELGVVLEPAAAEHLITAAYAGGLGAVEAELQKFAALAPGTRITRDVVGDLVGVRHGETVVDWTEAVLADDTARGLRLLGPVLEQSGVNGVRLVTALGSALVGLGLARAHHDKGLRGRALEDACFKAIMAARPFGLGDWKAVARLWARRAAQWPQPRLQGALRATLAADESLKSTTLSDERAVLELLVLRLARADEVRAA